MGSHVFGAGGDISFAIGSFETRATDGIVEAVIGLQAAVYKQAIVGAQDSFPENQPLNSAVIRLV